VNRQNSTSYDQNFVFPIIISLNLMIGEYHPNKAVEDPVMRKMFNPLKKLFKNRGGLTKAIIHNSIELTMSHSSIIKP
jgi:hypothetical protein